MQKVSAISSELPAACGSCKICTIHLERLCYQRAWWFRAFREVLASGIRIFAFVYGIRAEQHTMRSPMCKSCLRFRKNLLKDKSDLFNWLDGYLNPVFNRLRDSLLSDAEKEFARRLAQQAADPGFTVRSRS